MTFLQAIVIAIVEGISEFLPISSTGHMILTSAAMGIEDDSFTKLFTIAIQFGAILSVVVLYWRKFLVSTDFYLKLFVAFIPAAILGKLLNDYIDAMLESVITVGITLLLGGIILVKIDDWLKRKPEEEENEVSYIKAIKIGLFQCIAMIPGVSRSAATIVGGMTQKMSRTVAAEFSFFLAVPTMLAATVYKLYKYLKTDGFTGDQLNVLLVGNVVAFIVALIAIKGFITFLTKNGFKWFGYYRIALGAIILILALMGIDLKIA